MMEMMQIQQNMNTTRNIPQERRCYTVEELMEILGVGRKAVYGKTQWSPSVYSSNTGLINHYIEPYLGKLKLAEVTSHTLERYYQKLLTTPAVPMHSLSVQVSYYSELIQNTPGWEYAGVYAEMCPPTMIQMHPPCTPDAP